MPLISYALISVTEYESDIHWSFIRQDLPVEIKKKS